MEQNVKTNPIQVPVIARLILYAEYEVLMLTGVFCWYELLYTILYEFNWKFIVIWSWFSLQQYFYYMRSHDRLEIHKRTKWYHALPYWLCTGLIIYFLYNRISLGAYLEAL